MVKIDIHNGSEKPITIPENGHITVICNKESYKGMVSRRDVFVITGIEDKPGNVGGFDDE